MADKSEANGSSPDGAAVVQGKVTGIIYPPPEIRAIVDKTAQFVARNGREFEARIAGGTSSTKFAFLKPSDPYHAYYEHKVDEFIEQNAKESAQEASEAETATAQAAPASTTTTTEVEAVTEPQVSKAAPEQAPIESTKAVGDVVVEKKAVEAVTAKVAKKMKEKVMNPPEEERFKLKHPTLSALDQEIMYLTAQYTALSGKSFLSGLATREQRNPQFDFLKPTHPLFAYFTALVESYTQVLAKTEQQMQRITDGMDRMKVLDRCVHKLEWMRLEQEKKDKEAAENDAEQLALAQIDWHDFVIVETITFNDDEEAKAAEAAKEEAKSDDDMDMDMDMDEDSDEENAPKTKIKVVEDYVPQAAQPATSAAPLMQVDGKAIPTSDANEHMRILLMNPKWREETQRHLEKQKESSYAPGSDIADSLKRFATKRADIFSSSAEEQARLQKSMNSDQAASIPSFASQGEAHATSAAAPNTSATAPATSAAPGMTAYPPPPGTNPYGVPNMPPGVHPPHWGAHHGAPGTMAPPPGVAPPAMMPPGVPPPAPGMPPPPGVGAPGTSASGPPGTMGPGAPGVEPSAPGAPEGEPVAKRQRTEGPTLLTEEEFAALHPGNVRLAIKVPNDPDNAQWKLAGQTVHVEIDVKANMRSVKEKLSGELGGMPVNKQQLKAPAPVGFVKDALTCAHYNFVNGTSLELTVRQRGGRR